MTLEAYGPKDTFLAFTDISGFKNLMKEGDGPQALNTFFNAGYRQLEKDKPDHFFDGIFLSDSGILFARNDKHPELTEMDFLKKLLYIVKDLNKCMLDNNYMLTTSIAYGQFEYQNRIILRNMDKVFIHGYAYLRAYLDNNDKSALKNEPGYCRILKEGLPQDIRDKFDESNLDDPRDEFLEMIRLRGGDNKHYYYYWMREEPAQIDEFEKKYSNSYELKFGGMKAALRGGNSQLSSRG